MELSCIGSLFLLINYPKKFSNSDEITVRVLLEPRHRLSPSRSLRSALAERKNSRRRVAAISNLFMKSKAIEDVRRSGTFNAIYRVERWLNGRRRSVATAKRHLANEPRFKSRPRRIIITGSLVKRDLTAVTLTSALASSAFERIYFTVGFSFVATLSRCVTSSSSFFLFVPSPTPSLLRRRPSGDSSYASLFDISPR